MGYVARFWGKTTVVRYTQSVLWHAGFTTTYRLFPILCDVVNNSGSDVPAVNLITYHKQYVIAFHDTLFGDIRDFFPVGLSART